MPAAMISAGPAPASSWPSTWILPAVARRMPLSTSASSVWPLPLTPATPTISPQWTSKSMSWRAAQPVVAASAQAADLQTSLAVAPERLLSIDAEGRAADHHAGQLALVGVARRRAHHAAGDA